MKIIISPAKTQSDKQILDLPFSIPVFSSDKDYLLNIINSMSKEELGRSLSIEGKLLDQSYNYYHHQKINHAITLYTGQVFKQLDISNYKDIEIEYLIDNVIILSALYGVLKPFDEVQNYRLDMKSKIGVNLYDFWNDKITVALSDELIINLASDEFSSLYRGKNIYTIYFIEENGKVSGTHSKIARGKFLNHMIKNNIKTINEILEIEIDGYKYCADKSKNMSVIYKRNIKKCKI